MHYQVLNPAFATGASASFGRLFYNVVRNDAPQDLKDVFKAGGYLCQHQNAFLIPFGNTPLGDDQNAIPILRPDQLTARSRGGGPRVSPPPRSP